MSFALGVLRCDEVRVRLRGIADWWQSRVTIRGRRLWVPNEWIDCDFNERNVADR